MRIQILIDNPQSWIIPYGVQLKSKLTEMGYHSELLHDQSDVKEGDILCLLGCESVFKNLGLNIHNLVVHESALPNGKGWSPLSWQVLKGKNRIPITLFEAVEAVDAGPIYNQIYIELNGTELIDEIRIKQANATLYLILDFISKYPNNKTRAQRGKSSFFKRRRPEDSKLDIKKTLSSQFNMLRICDNERYPVYFEKNGVKYILKIYKA